MKIQKALVFALIGCGFAIKMHSHSPENLTMLTAAELKKRHDAVITSYETWIERSKNAMPKIILVEERAKAARAAQQAMAVCEGINRDIEIRKAKMAEMQRELHSLQKDRVAAELEEIRLKRISEDYRNRSTTEKVEKKLKHLIHEAKSIQAAFNDISRWLRINITLSRHL